MDEEAPYIRLRDDVVDEIRNERYAQPQAADESAEHVGVGDDQRVVLRVSNEIGEVADLQVGPDRPVVDHELQLEAGKVLYQSIDDADGRIVLVAHPEDDLEAPIILPAKAHKVFVQ